MVALGILWGWFDWTALVLLGHQAMLHPAEFLTAYRKDLVLPRDTMYTVHDVFLHIR